MASLAARVETIKLARALGTDEDDLAFLLEVDDGAIRALRTACGEALFQRHEARFRRVAKLAGAVPASLAGRIAQLAMGPHLSARVAAVMEPELAVKLAGALSTPYLVDLSTALDPVRAEPILHGLPPELIVEVGQLLLERREYVTLGRFVSVIPPAVALRVVAGANGSDLVQVALYADDPAALDALVAQADPGLLLAAIRAAHEEEMYDDAITLVANVSVENQARLISLIATLGKGGADGFIRSIDAHAAWQVVLPGLAALDDESLAALANTPAALQPGLLDRAVAIARGQGLGDLGDRLVASLRPRSAHRS